MRPIWKLVRGCLEDQRCSEAVENRQAALEMFQEERSEQADSEKDIENSESIDSEEELQALVEQMERTRIRKKEKGREKGDPKREECCEPSSCQAIPSAPPLYVEGGQGGSRCTFCPGDWKAVRTELRLAYPVFQDPQGNRYEEPLDFKIIKSLAESVRTYGTRASFKVAQVEALN